MLYFKILYFKKVNRPLFSDCVKQLLLTPDTTGKILLNVKKSQK